MGPAEIARRSIELFNAHDVEGFLELVDPDCELLPFRAQLEGTPYRGHEGVRQFVRDMDEDWEMFRIEPIEEHERGELVVVIGRITARGRGSSVDVDARGGFVLELRDGRIHRLTSYSDPDAALEAGGVR